MYIQQYFTIARGQWQLCASHFFSCQMGIFIEIILSLLHENMLKDGVTDNSSFLVVVWDCFVWFLLLFIIFSVKNHIWSWCNMFRKSWTLSQCCDWIGLLWCLFWERVNAFPCSKKTECNSFSCIIFLKDLLLGVSVYNPLQENISTEDYI